MLKGGLKKVLIPLAAFALVASGWFLGRTEKRAQIQRVRGDIPNFVLLDQNGEAHELYRLTNSAAVVLITHGNGCPLVQKSAIFLKELAGKFAGKNVRFLMLNGNSQDSREDVAREASEFGIDLPILLDPAQVVTRKLGFRTTAEALIIDPKTWSVAYRGAIDDRFQLGAVKPTSKGSYLEDALKNVLKGRAVAAPWPDSVGCRISFPNHKTVNFDRQILPLLRSKCLNCHGQGRDIRPTFRTHKDLIGWTEMIRETLLTQRMPPWGLDPHYGKFANDGSITPEETALLHQWLDDGMPKGKTETLEVAVERNELPKPDFQLDIGTDQVIPPEGFVEYKYFQLSGPVDNDMYIHAVRVTPSVPEQVHHISLLVTDQSLEEFDEAAESSADSDEIKSYKDGAIPLWTLNEMRKRRRQFPHFLQKQVYASGRQQPNKVPKHKRVIYVPKGAYLIAQMHYNGSGKTVVDRTRFDFYEYKRKEKPQVIRAGWVVNTEIEIPPHAEKHVTTHYTELKKPIYLLAFNPHMHMRGRSLKLNARFPDGRFETLFSIPNYYYGWHVGAAMVFAEPILLPIGTMLEMIAIFDNSANNPYNPDPTKTVYFGQTVDKTEMPKINYQYVSAEGRKKAPKRRLQ